MPDEAATIIRALLDDEPDARRRASDYLTAVERQQQVREINVRVREAIEAKLLTFVPEEPPVGPHHNSWQEERLRFVWHQMEYLTWRINGYRAEIVAKPIDPLNRPPSLLGPFYGRDGEILPALAKAATTALVRELRKYDAAKKG